MGKDQELLEAARNGNVTLIEKILYQKGKRSGPLASLRRGPGANIQDSTGYSALHHASLNGRTDCVRLLLAHDASPNLPDYRGSSPLHLAAWAGHQDIVKLLLTQSTRPANPNLQTIDNETPLHCAAQHGHTGALTTLLAHGANPKMANNRGERPLDLAAQYGRLQVVQMLIRAHPELLLPFNKDYDDEQFSDTDSGCSRTILTHSPLHLASRNGHKNVVEILLAAGVDVNLLTTSGTALHEAALCGKDTVVKALLDFGADLNVTDSEGRTALDLLKQFPPHVTKGIISVINNHQNSFSSEQEDLLKVSRNISSSADMYGSVGSHYSKRNMRQSNLWNSYSNESAGSMLESPSSSVDSLDPSSPRQRPSATDSSGGGSFYVTMVPLKSGSKVSPTPPKKPPRRNLSISPTTSKPLTAISAISRNNATGTSNNSSAPYEYIYLAHSGNKKTMSKAASVDQYVKMMNPQQRLLQQQQHHHLLQEESFNNLDSDEIPPTTVLRSYNPNRKLRRIRDNYDSFCTTSPYESTSAHNESDDNLPMSPSNYKQPPTPEHPPPNARHAEKVILERIRPLSQEYRRSIALENIGKTGNATFGGFPNRSRNQNQYNSYQRQPVQQPQRNSHHFGDTSASPSSSDLLMCHSLNASSGSLSSSVSLSDRSASTDCVEEFIADVPFAGLFKGSTMTLDKPNLLKYGINNSPPMTQPNSKPIQMPRSEQSQSGHKKQHLAPTSASLPQPQQQLHQSRPERPRTLDTQTSSLSILKSSSIPFSIAPDQFTSTSQTSNSKLKSFSTSVVGGEAKKPSKLIENDANAEANKVDVAATTPSAKTFDEQEEWAKISEIMANFGTDDSLTTSAFGGSTRRRVYQNRMDNGRSNSVAGYASYTDTGKSQLGLSMHSVNSLGSPRDVDSQRSISPHGQLIDWLYSNELESLDRILYDNGFDDVDFIRGVLDEGDLDTLDVPVDDRPKLMAAMENDLQTPARAVSKFMKTTPTKSGVYSSFDTNDKVNSGNAVNNNVYAQSTANNNNYSTIPKQKGLNAGSSDSNATLSVEEWLASIKLQQYSEVFKKHLYTDMERISGIWEIELQAVLEINKLGHRKRILYSVGAAAPKIGSQLTAYTNSATTESSQRNASSTMASTNSDSNTGEQRRNHRKNRQAPKPPTNESILAKMNELKLEIRAPSELLLGFPTGLSTQWRHTAEALVSGAVKYEVNYLGSTVVKELRGTESTRKSIQKLKKGERISAANAGVGNAALNNVNQNMKRAVYILISHRGVQFVDIKSQGTICEHEIRNINCACQDADDLSHFAYITKDSDYDTHYCHVFNVITMDLATEIILTLGQAFEVAYQIALRKSTPTPLAPSPIDINIVNATTNDDSVVQKESK